MNTFKSNGLRRAGICLAMVALGASCGGESNSEKQTGGVGGAGGEGGSGGSGGSGGGTGGATGGTGGAGTGGATGGTGGAGTGGATGGTGGAGTGGATGGTGGAGTGGATGGAAGSGTGGTTGGTAGDAGTTGGAAGSGGSTGGSAGAGGSAGGSAGAGGGDAGGCPSYASFTLAIHIILDVKWDGSLATNAGTGKVHLWNRAKLNANGTMLDGLAGSCGTSLPDISLNLAGQLAAGGMKVLIEIPFAAWEAPSIPTFEQKGTLAGWNPGSAVEMQPTVALVGLTMNDAANAAWPASYTMIMGADAEADGKLGITGNAKKGDPGGYVYPPTAIGLGGLAPAADKVYIASRTVLQLSGKTTTCDDQTGTATAKFFDNHVIGCHVFNGAECNADQTKFVDDSRTVYVPTAPGTFAAKRIADNATCADVRAALP